jgi:hypothetical protein
MKIRRSYPAVALVTTFGTLLTAGLFASPVLAGVLYQEDFEAYAVGSNITGQGGWVPDYAYSAINVGNGAHLPTKVLNGLLPTNDQQNYSARPLGFSLDPDAISTLSFDAYAVNAGGVHTHNALIGIGDSSIMLFNSGGIYWAVERVGGGPDYHWAFFASSLTGTSTDIYNLPAGGYNTAVAMGIVIDGVANQVYGIYDFGAGPLETPRYAVTDAQIATLDELGVEVDFRYSYAGYVGPELDNLLLSETGGGQVPEPSTLSLAGLGAVAGFVARRRKVRKA